MRLRFGEFELDEEARELRRVGRRIEVRRKVLELLEALVRARPRAVARAELSDCLWPGTAVAYTSLPGVVAELREALGDDPRSPRFVRTVRGFGYAFVAEAVPTASEPARRASVLCALMWCGREVGLREGETLIGRTEDCAIRIDSGRISRRHARIVIDADWSATLEDLGSKNGTFIHDQRIETPQPLVDGDFFDLGRLSLRFHFASGGRDSTKTERGEERRGGGRASAG